MDGGELRSLRTLALAVGLGLGLPPVVGCGGETSAAQGECVAGEADCPCLPDSTDDSCLDATIVASGGDPSGGSGAQDETGGAGGSMEGSGGSATESDASGGTGGSGGAGGSGGSGGTSAGASGAGGSGGWGGSGGSGGSGGLGGSNASGGSGGFSPLCDLQLTQQGLEINKGVPCDVDAGDPEVCYLECGPEGTGYKTETCLSVGYAEGDCVFTRDDYSCYAIPSELDASCPDEPPRASQACDVAECTPCNVEDQYLTATGEVKDGYCVCTTMGTWSCATVTAWPCPFSAGC